MDKKKKFKISLIIPAHNEEKYIGSCLEYALNNSGGKFFEIIVIDNASTDKTSEIAKSFPGVRVIYEENKGLTFARQRGFLESQGEILTYIDADTRMPQGYYERIESEFNKNPKLASFSGPHDYYDVSKFYKILNKIYWELIAFPSYVIIGYMIIGVSFAARRDILEKINGFDTSIAFYGEDTNIARRIHKYGKVKFSTNFTMPTSGRRLREYGIFKIGYIYVINFISEVVLHKPATRIYKDIR